jgi:hypothetical protein
MKHKYRPGWGYWYLEILFSVQVHTVSVEAIKRAAYHSGDTLFKCPFKFRLKKPSEAVFNSTFPHLIRTEITIASSQTTCQSCSWHLTAAVYRKVTNQINEIYLQKCCWSWSGRPDHEQQHCYHHAPKVNQRLLLQLLSSWWCTWGCPKHVELYLNDK